MLAAPPRAFGADQVLVDVPFSTSACAPRSTVARYLEDGETIVNYGVLSGQACAVDARGAVFRDVSLRGFWLRRWLMQTPPECVAALFRELAAKVTDGTVAVDVEAFYPIGRIKEALAHAACSGRSGSILVTFPEA
jgi:trans-2-enoyl-CoA reductase